MSKWPPPLLGDGNYHEIAVKCFSEGYHAAQRSLNGGEVERNPYQETQRYCHEAWDTGFNWYMVMVH